MGIAPKKKTFGGEKSGAESKLEEAGDEGKGEEISLSLDYD